MDIILRDLEQDDIPEILNLCVGTNVFYDYEIETLEEVLQNYLDVAQDYDHYCWVAEENAETLGFIYFAATEMTERTWDLWWIAVTPARHGQGVGKHLIQAMEEHVRQAQGRMLLIETSSLPPYEPTRRFYLKLDYHLVATIPEYYRPGDSKHIFQKML